MNIQKNKITAGDDDYKETRELSEIAALIILFFLISIITEMVTD